MPGSAFRGPVFRSWAVLLSAVLAAPLPAASQVAAPISPAILSGTAPLATAGAGADTATQLYSKEQLDALLAPVALYPDTLLTQILMASTLPVQMLQARLWLENPAHKALTGDALAKALEAQNWDPGVKSLVPFPQVLMMMTNQAEWMQQIGYAMSVQQAEVLDSVQRLRRQAQLAGSLATTPQQKVTTEPSAHPGAPPVILVVPTDPQIVYVPSYNPAQVYGAWPYPAAPPVYLPPPPGYAIGTALITGMAFATGVAVVGSLWNVGRPVWGAGSVNVNVNRWNTINVNRPPIHNGNWRPPSGGGNYPGGGNNPRPPGGPGGRPIQPPAGPVGPPNRGNGLPANAIGRPSVQVPGDAVNRPPRPGGGGVGPGGANLGAAGANRPNPPGTGGVAGRPPLPNAGGGNSARPNPGGAAPRPAQRPAQPPAQRPVQRPVQRPAQPPAARPASSPEAFSGMREGRQAPAFANRGAQSRSSGGGGGVGGGGGRAHHGSGVRR